MSVGGGIVVTGAGGFIGRHVVAELERREVGVVPVLRRWKDIDEIRAQSEGATSCIHLGWYARPADYLSSVEGNARSLSSTAELVQALADLGCEHLLVAGSAAEYGESIEPHREEEALAPSTIYGAAKALCGTQLLEVRPPPFPVAWGRLFNVIGPGEHPARILPTAITALRSRRDLDLSGGTQVRDYIDVRDAARALVELAAGRARGAINICTGVGTSLRSLLEEAADVVGGGRHLRFGRIEAAGLSASLLVGDPTKLVKFGFRPRHSRRETIEAMADRSPDA